ncbi:response regulator transcription factor [Bacteroidota bacterium]
MKILIVDDSKLLRERLLNLISEISGVEVVGTAENALSGYNSAKILLPDIAIVDISMPGGGGIKLLQQIKKDLPSVVVIILTNYPFPKYREKCNELGADYFFSKLKDIDNLTKLIGELSTQRTLNMQETIK